MARPRTITDEQILGTMRSSVLEHGPAVSLDLVAEKLGVTKPSVVRVMNLLMERGMIVKEYYGKIYLTDRGIFVAREVKKQLDEVLAHFPPVEEELTDEERLTAALALTAALPERVFTGRYDQLMGAEEAPPAAG